MGQSGHNNSIKVPIFLVLSVFIFLFSGGSKAFAEEQKVGFVSEISGDYSVTRAGGREDPLKVGATLFENSIIKRKGTKGYIVFVNGDGYSPNRVETTISTKGWKPIPPDKWDLLQNAIAGTSTRPSKRAVETERFWAWATDLGSVLQQDVESGQATLVLSADSNSGITKRYFPLVWQVASEYTIKGVRYRIVGSKQFSSEGEFHQLGKDFFFPIRELACPLDTTFRLQLTVELQKAWNEERITFQEEVPFTVVANDGFIEDQVAKATAVLVQGIEHPDLKMFQRLASLSVYYEYNMNLYALSSEADK